MENKERALRVVGSAIYADPMMDEVLDVRLILKKLPEEKRLLLLCTVIGGWGVMGILDKFYATTVTSQLNAACDMFIEELDKVYGKQVR